MYAITSEAYKKKEEEKLAKQVELEKLKELRKFEREILVMLGFNYLTEKFFIKIIFLAIYNTMSYGNVIYLLCY